MHIKRWFINIHLSVTIATKLSGHWKVNKGILKRYTRYLMIVDFALNLFVLKMLEIDIQRMLILSAIIATRFFVLKEQKNNTRKLNTFDDNKNLN
jgi:hypothetical protein